MNKRIHEGDIMRIVKSCSLGLHGCEVEINHVRTRVGGYVQVEATLITGPYVGERVYLFDNQLRVS
jgi:hypothetical protein